MTPCAAALGEQLRVERVVEFAAEHLLLLASQRPSLKTV